MDNYLVSEMIPSFNNNLNIFEEASTNIKDVAMNASKDIVDMLLDVKEEDITFTFIMELFGEFNGKQKVQPFDYMTVPPGKYGPEGKKNKNSFNTTAGIWIFNKYFIEKELFDLFGYMNETVNNKTYKKMNSRLSYALLEDDISIDQLKNYLLKTQKFMPFVSILSPNYSEKMLTCTKEINKYKDKLIKENKEALESGDIVTMDKIDKQVLDFALDYMGDDPAMDTFISGARSTIGNNFKNLFCMKGAIRDPDPAAKIQYNFATSNYMDGIKKEEYGTYARSLSGGPFSRSRKTANGGYWEKLFGSAFQHLHLGPPDSDCGTSRYITVEFTDKKVVESYMYSYVIKSNGTLEEITSKNMDSFIGKTVKLRFSSMCEYNDKNNPDCFCNKCAGNFLYRLQGDIINVGLGTVQIPSKLKLIAMKAFHDSTIDLSEMDPMKAFDLE